MAISPCTYCLHSSLFQRHQEYYMGEGGGFSRIRVVVSHMSPGSHVACPSIESAPECELINLLGLM